MGIDIPVQEMDPLNHTNLELAYRYLMAQTEWDNLADKHEGRIEFENLVNVCVDLFYNGD